MKTLVALEELGLAVLGWYVFVMSGQVWWLFLLLFFAPDIAMLGYLAGPKAGGVIYNIVHHRGLAVVLAAVGFLGGQGWLLAAGGIILAHSSVDRIFGYGLKHTDAFKHTHLGWIGESGRGGGSGPDLRDS